MTVWCKLGQPNLESASCSDETGKETYTLVAVFRDGEREQQRRGKEKGVNKRSLKPINNQINN